MAELSTIYYILELDESLKLDDVDPHRRPAVNPSQLGAFRGTSSLMVKLATTPAGAERLTGSFVDEEVRVVKDEEVRVFDGKKMRVITDVEVRAGKDWTELSTAEQGTRCSIGNFAITVDGRVSYGRSLAWDESVDDRLGRVRWSLPNGRVEEMVYDFYSDGNIRHVMHGDYDAAIPIRLHDTWLTTPEIEELGRVLEDVVI